MVQAAAQAQAVVAAAKSRGDGLVPMNAQQIAALSQIQAQAIVNARPQTALLASGTPTIGKDGKAIKPTPAQIQHQIQLQAQALVHAHTQAQISAGIYKGDGATSAASNHVPTPSPTVKTLAMAKSGHKLNTNTASNSVAGFATPSAVSHFKKPVSNVGGALQSVVVNKNIYSTILPVLSHSQLNQQNALSSRQANSHNATRRRHSNEIANLRSHFQQSIGVSAPGVDVKKNQENQLSGMSKRHGKELEQMKIRFAREMVDLHGTFRKQNAAAEYAGISVATVPNPSANNGSLMMATLNASPSLNTVTTNGNSLSLTQSNNSIKSHPVAQIQYGSVAHQTSSDKMNSLALSNGNEGIIVPSATSKAFLEELSKSLNVFWTTQLEHMRSLGKTVSQTEQDFKNHNDLPLARIKRIMKSDEDVRMISAEAPVLFAKACEMFILELTLRSWTYSENNKRRTLQKEDIREAIQRTDIFDFLVDVIH